MKRIYSIIVWEPDAFACDWTVSYYCSHTIAEYPSESIWIVPGTLNLED